MNNELKEIRNNLNNISKDEWVRYRRIVEELLKDDPEIANVVMIAIDKQIGEKLSNKYPIVTGDTVSGKCPKCYDDFVCIIPKYYNSLNFGYCKTCGQKIDLNMG